MKFYFHKMVYKIVVSENAAIKTGEVFELDSAAAEPDVTDKRSSFIIRI